MSEQDGKEPAEAEEKADGKSARKSNGDAAPPAQKAGEEVVDGSAELQTDNVNGDKNLGAVMGIPVTVQVLLGSTLMPVAQLLKLGRGAIITLDRRVGEPVDIVVNGTIVARGEIVGAEDDTYFGVSLTEIVGKPALEGSE